MTPAQRPWLSGYGSRPHHLEPSAPDALTMFKQSVARSPRSTLIQYQGRSLSLEEVDRLSDAVACALDAHGVTRKDRVAFVLQNVPEFVIALLAVWKLGAIVVPINPMYRERELETILADAGAAIVIADEGYAAAIPTAMAAGGERTVIACSPAYFAANGLDPRTLGSTAPSGAAAGRWPAFHDLASAFSGRQPDPVSLDPEDVAFLTYTSGTTGPPKGAMNLHRNVVFSAQTYRDWIGLDDSDTVLGIAPLFHITGLVAHIALTMLTGGTLLLGYRFEPSAVLNLIETGRPTFTVGAITALMALINHPTFEHRDLTSLTKVYSGGQPVSAAAADAIERRLGAQLHIAYGMTETTSPSHLIPFGVRPPTDPETGALSVGVPVFDTTALVLGESNEILKPGELGEIVIGGPQVVPGYWGAPSEGQAAFMPGGLIRTGDIGYMNDNGWFFVIDRKKDLINASGYKIWPREVEDVLSQHPDVVEAAVVGVPDSYRGETVKAFVSLVGGASVTADELIAFCRDRLAPYKCPRLVAIVEEIPKNAAGKILRRLLRDGPDSARA